MRVCQLPPPTKEGAANFVRIPFSNVTTVQRSAAGLSRAAEASTCRERIEGPAKLWLARLFLDLDTLVVSALLVSPGLGGWAGCPREFVCGLLCWHAWLCA